MPDDSIIARVHVPLTDDIVLNIIYVSGTRKDAKKIADQYPTTRCTHSWDCCGGWYQHSPAKIRRAQKYYDKIWAVETIVSQNV